MANAADKDDLKNQKNKEKFKNKQQEMDLKFILGTEQGRRLLWRYLGLAGVFEQSAHASGSWTYFNEGRRSIGLRLLTEITETDANLYLKMMLEHQNQGETNAESDNAD